MSKAETAHKFSPLTDKRITRWKNYTNNAEQKPTTRYGFSNDEVGHALMRVYKVLGEEPDILNTAAEITC